MSWGEVTKINSDLTTPLNALLWINDLKTYGKESYVYKSVDILMELAKYTVAVNDPVCNTLIIDGIQTQGVIGKFLKEYLNSDNSGFDSVKTLYDFAKVDSLVTEVFSNSNLSTLMFAAPSFAGVARSSDTSISDVLYSNEAFTDGVITKGVYIGEAGMSNTAWKNILDRTDFIDKLLLPENRELLKQCIGSGSFAGTLLEGLARSAKGLNRFVKANLPPDILLVMYSKYKQSDYGTYLNMTLGSTLYFTLAADRWSSAELSNPVNTEYFNGANPLGTTTEVTDCDNSIAIMKEVGATETSTSKIYRMSHPGITWLTANNTTTTVTDYVAIGGFFVNPPVSGQARLRYKMYIAK